MFLQRSAIAAARRVAISPIVKRGFATSLVRREAPAPPAGASDRQIKKFAEIKDENDLFGPGAAPGTVPTDLEQATGLERFEILGKMEGIDVFDMKPLDSSRKGTLEDPIIAKSFGDEQYVGCTGYPVDSHTTIWITVSRDRPIERCSECGGVYKMEYVGPPDDEHHADGHHKYEEPKTFADYIRPEYRYR